jgi:hypothetical protein
MSASKKTITSVVAHGAFYNTNKSGHIPYEFINDLWRVVLLDGSCGQKRWIAYENGNATKQE